ncbi:MAG: hypothetical protein GX974_10125 [Clostridiales bacterium]|nr:hypothetical protein [Clostridiales bacterium]
MFIPYPFYWDDVPIDISFIFEDEKPAGRHGFLKVDKEDFVFENGKKAVFWGSNFNSGLNFPPFDVSEKISKRLSKIGVNLVRFHQMDAEWATPNIFQFSKGERKGNTLSFDPKSMKRLDYLIYCLKKEGIYIYMDMLTYRKFKSGDGVKAALELEDAARPYCIFDRKLIELQKKFNYDLWTHINPYTNLAYKDDPAIALTEIINEGDMFSRPVTIPYYKKSLDEMCYKWLKERGLKGPDKDIDYSSKDPIIIEFLMQVQENYYREMIDHLREIGVKIPITGTNWAINAANRKTQSITDFDDGHAYWYGWKWKEDKKEFNNNSMISKRYTMLTPLAFQRQLGRPYFVSEWDMPWPNEWRAESPLFMAAIGALQNWAGYAIHTYSYTAMKNIDVTGKEVTSQAIGSVPYREGVFNTWNDPAKFGLFYHCALLMRRGDVKEAKKSYEIEIEDMSLTPSDIPVLNLMPERHKVGLKFDLDSKPIGDIIMPDEMIIEADNEEILSDTGEVYRSWNNKIGWVDSERTKAIYGFIGNVEEINLEGLKFTSKTDFATIALSSLTDDPINSSDNILLTAVGRAENTDMKFNETKDEMLDVGRDPILVEVVEVDIGLKSSQQNLRVWAVNAEGFFAGVIPSTYEDGILKFTLGNEFKSMYYLIQAE